MTDTITAIYETCVFRLSGYHSKYRNAHTIGEQSVPRIESTSSAVDLKLGSIYEKNKWGSIQVIGLRSQLLVSLADLGLNVYVSCETAPD